MCIALRGVVWVRVGACGWWMCVASAHGNEHSMRSKRPAHADSVVPCRLASRTMRWGILSHGRGTSSTARLSCRTRGRAYRRCWLEQPMPTLMAIAHGRLSLFSLASRYASKSQCCPSAAGPTPLLCCRCAPPLCPAAVPNLPRRRAAFAASLCCPLTPSRPSCRAVVPMLSRLFSPTRLLLLIGLSSAMAITGRDDLPGDAVPGGLRTLGGASHIFALDHGTIRGVVSPCPTPWRWGVVPHTRTHGGLFSRAPTAPPAPPACSDLIV